MIELSIQTRLYPLTKVGHIKRALLCPGLGPCLGAWKIFSMPVNWAAIDRIDTEELIKKVYSAIEAPADFRTNLWHFAHGTSHLFLSLFVLALVIGGSLKAACYMDRKRC